MKQAILFCLLLMIHSIVSAQSPPLSDARWQPLTSTNAHALSLVYEVDLSSILPSMSIIDIDLVSYSGVFFISYLDLSVNQGGWMLWDSQSQQPILEQLIIAKQQLDGFLFSPYGKFLVIRTDEASNFDITETCLWHISSGEKLHCWDTTIFDMQFTHDEQTLILAGANQVIGWDIQKNIARFTIPQLAVSIAISPDDTNLILDRTDSIFIWNIQTDTPYEIQRQILDDKVIVEELTLDILGRYVFFNTISLFSSGEIELGILDISSNTITYIEREVIPQDFFSSQYVRLFLFKQPDSAIADIIDPITGANYGTTTRFMLRDNTLAQDIFIAREEVINGLFTYSVKNFETQETLITLYENSHDRRLNIQFTPDERFILTYTEEGIVQMWGVIN